MYNETLIDAYNEYKHNSKNTYLSLHKGLTKSTGYAWYKYHADFYNCPVYCPEWNIFKNTLGYIGKYKLSEICNIHIPNNDDGDNKYLEFLVIAKLKYNWYTTDYRTKEGKALLTYIKKIAPNVEM
jgi:hypothetical protein